MEEFLEFIAVQGEDKAALNHEEEVAPAWAIGAVFLCWITAVVAYAVCRKRNLSSQPPRNEWER